MNKYKSYGKGWHNDSYKHSLAAKGIKTSFAGWKGESYSHADIQPMVGKQRYVIKQVGDKFAIVDNDIGEFLIGFTFETNEQAEDFINENLKKKSMAGKVISPWVGNIEKETLDNNNFRKVIATGKKEQLVLMSLKPGEDIGDEVHPDTDQFIRVEEGTGKAVFNEKESHKLNNKDATVITAGTFHNIINTSKKKPLKLYTVYAPPHHKPGIIQKNKPGKD